MPYPNEHSAILKNSTTEKTSTLRTRGSGKGAVQGVRVPETISVKWYVQKKEIPIAQALRFPIKRWTADAAKKWLSDNKVKYVSFEAAVPKEKDAAKIPFYSSYIDKTKKEINLFIDREVGSYGIESGELGKMLIENKEKPVNLDINSPGGHVFAGFSIYNMLKAHPSAVNVKVSGIAASIASVIAMAGDNIEMPENAMLMIHKPFIPFMSGADSNKLRKEADALDKIESGIVASYRNRMDKTDEEIKKLMLDTTWFTANEALDAGLADEITEEIDVENYHDFEVFNYGDIPATVLNKFDVDGGELFGAAPGAWKYCVCEKCDYSVTHKAGEPCGKCPKCGEQMIGRNEKPGNTNLDKIIEFIKNHFNLKKEPNVMEPKEMENKITDLEKATADLEKEKTDLEKVNTDLQKIIDDNKNAVDKMNTEAREKEHKVFCEKMVSEGRIRPADVDNHTETMDLKFQADAKDGKEDTPKLDAYKTMLGELPEIVPVNNRHIADKNKAADTGDKDLLDEAAKKIVSDSKKSGHVISYSDAIKQAFEENPELGKNL